MAISRNINVSSTGKILNCEFNNSCIINITKAGSASNCIFGENTTVSANSAFLYDCTFNNNNTVKIGTNTVLTNINMTSDTVISSVNGRIGGTNNTFYSGCLTQVTAAYTDENHKIRNLVLPTGALHIISSAQVDGANISGYLHVYGGAVVSNAIINVPANNRGIMLSSGGGLYNIQIESSKGFLYYLNNTSMHTLGGSSCNIPQSQIMYNTYNNGYIDPSLYISSGIVRGLTLKNTTSNVVRLTVNSGLLISSGVISSGGTLFIQDGGQCSNMAIVSKGSAFFCDNITVITDSSILGNRGICTCNNINISKGGYALYRGTNMSGNSVTVNSAAILRVQNGAVVSNVVVSSGGTAAINQNDSATYIDYEYSPTVDGLTINQGAIVTIGKNATLKNITMASGTVITPTESASLTNLNIAEGAKCDLNSLEDVTSGAKIEGSNTNAPEGTLYYMGNQLNCVISNGVVTKLGDNGAYYRIQFGSDMVINQPKVYSGCRVYGQKNCIVSGASIFTSGNIGLLESATGYGVVLGGEGLSNATYNLFDNASAYNTTIYMGGMHQLVSQSVNSTYSSKVMIYSGGIMRVNRYGSADDITVNSVGELHVRSGGIISNAIINSGGTLNISSGASALGIIANEGAIIINNGYISYNS